MMRKCILCALLLLALTPAGATEIQRLEPERRERVAQPHFNFSFLFTAPVSAFDIDIYDQGGTFIESWHFAAGGVVLGSLAGWTRNFGPMGVAPVNFTDT